MCECATHDSCTHACLYVVQALVVRALLEVFCTSADNQITQEHMKAVPSEWIQRK